MESLEVGGATDDCSLSSSMLTPSGLTRASRTLMTMPRAGGGALGRVSRYLCLGMILVVQTVGVMYLGFVAYVLYYDLCFPPFFTPCVDGSDAKIGSRICLGICAVIFVPCCACCPIFWGPDTEARVDGYEDVMQILQAPFKQDVHFHWAVECSHQHVHSDRAVSVRTNLTELKGVLVSSDRTPAFVPDTSRGLSRIKARLDVQLPQSYVESMQRFKDFYNNGDQSVEMMHCEELPGLPTGEKTILAVWDSSKWPWWLSNKVSLLAHALFCGCWYHLSSHRHVVQQDYIYTRVVADFVWQPGLNDQRPEKVDRSVGTRIKNRFLDR